MTLALATRGYLRRVVPNVVVQVGEGPPIVNAEVLAPRIAEAAPDPQAGPPSIVDAEDLAPGIRGATEGSTTPPSPPPQGSGTVLAPIIRGATES